MDFSNSMSIQSFYHVCAVIKRPKQVLTLALSQAPHSKVFFLTRHYKYRAKIEWRGENKHMHVYIYFHGPKKKQLSVDPLSTG